MLYIKVQSHYRVWQCCERMLIRSHMLVYVWCMLGICSVHSIYADIPWCTLCYKQRKYIFLDMFKIVQLVRAYSINILNTLTICKANTVNAHMLMPYAKVWLHFKRKITPSVWNWKKKTNKYCFLVNIINNQVEHFFNYKKSQSKDTWLSSIVFKIVIAKFETTMLWTVNNQASGVCIKTRRSLIAQIV